MNKLNALQADKLNEFGQKLLTAHRNPALSFETTARTIAQAIYNEFVDDNNKPAFALVRIFRISTYPELMTDMQKQVNPDDEQWLTLMATYGEEPNWCNPRLSQRHRFISRSNAAQSPMLNEVFNQLGLRWLATRTPLKQNRLQVKQLNQYITRYFYVPQALGSPYIVSQDDFVKPYHIESVIGVGSLSTSGAATIAIGFSKVAVDERNADIFAELGPYLFTLLNNKTVFWVNDSA